MNRIACLTTWRVLGVLMVILCVGAGCEQVAEPPPEKEPPMPDDMPADFWVKSEYIGPALPPQYHFEFYIVLDCAATDTISFHPDYIESDPPIWAETFNASGPDLESLYDLMREKEIFRDHWTLIEDPIVGAARRSLLVEGDNRQFHVPMMVEDTAAVNRVYLTIDGLVPDAIWDTLWARRDRYIEDYP